MGSNKFTRKPKSKRTPYSRASDDEKVRRNWNKTKGLFDKAEWSVAILRCGTSLELAINAAIREELVENRDLPLPFVDKLLKNANGLHNKFHNIYLPIMEEYQEHEELKGLWKSHISKINNERNAIVHSGEFRSESVAEEVMEHGYMALQKIMDLHGNAEKIKPFKT